MVWPLTRRERLDAAHRALRLLLAQVYVDGSMATVDFALSEDPDAALEVLAATGRVPLDRLTMDLRDTTGAPEGW